MQTEASTITLAFTALPAIGAELEGGIFAGIITQRDGTHVAVVLLPTQGKDLNWKDAQAWAAEQGGQLPSRPVAALIFANVKDRPQSGWHWTSDEAGASYAWGCRFYYGSQFTNRKSFEGCAVAVRLIHLSA